VVGARAAVVVARQLHEVEHAEDADQQDAWRPHPHVGRGGGAGEDAPTDDTAETCDVAVEELLVDGFLALCDGERNHRREHRQRLEQWLRAVVVRGADEAPREEVARKEPENDRGEHAAEPTAQTLSDEVRWNGK